MIGGLVARLLVRPLWLAAALAGFVPVGAPRLAAQSMEELLAQSAPCDVDGDGVAEVERLELLRSTGASDAPRVVVLVEQRLLAAPDAAERALAAELRARLERLADDLGADGYRAELIAAAVYGGPEHQDGRTLLGLRRLLIRCHDAAPLAGALLIGHFPDALLLRTCNWRKRGALELPGADGQPLRFPEGQRYLRRVTELVAHKCDLVLADLDGGWEARYAAASTVYPGVVAVFGDRVPATGGACVAWAAADRRYSDAFHVDDGAVVLDAAARTLAIDDGARDHELATADRERPNPIARPEIAVSRIDARGVAWSPWSELLDPRGRPRERAFAAGEAPPADLWHADPALERRLLIDYLDRNHRFRAEGCPAEGDRPASIAWKLPSGMPAVRAARAEWHDFDEPGFDVTREVDLCALVDWLRRPALLRTLRAHSDGAFAAFARTDAARLEAQVGVAWNWQVRDSTATPSLAAACRGGRADVGLYRTLFENRVLPEAPYFLVHTGCEAISPPGAARFAYHDPAYDRGQQAAALLFFTPCLALIGRAKVFYDEPARFAETLAEGASFGAAWQRGFEQESLAADWGSVGGDISRKRASFWSLLGDWTLRLPRR